MSNKKTIERLHKYKDILFRLKQMGFVKIFSDNLADSVGVTASQVRRDLSAFGFSGNKRGGYLIDELLSRLHEILGKNRTYEVIVAGAGNIGKALIHYKGFPKIGVNIVAAFDSDPAKIVPEADVPVLPVSEMKEFIKNKQIKVGVIAVPDVQAQPVLDAMIESGIKGVVNFTPIRLNVPEGFIINNVNVGLKLETVIYYVSSLEDHISIKRDGKKKNTVEEDLMSN